MDPSEHEELSRLRREQERLKDELTGLSSRLRELEARMAQTDEGPIAPAKAPRSTPPPIPESVRQRATANKLILPAATHPDSLAPAESSQGSQDSKEPAAPVDFKQAVHEAAEARQSQQQDAAPASPKPTSDWELDLGRVWFVRAGVGLLLTGMVFLSLYAYKNWIFAATAAVKVSFFFAVSLAMVGGGYFLERRRVDLRQYGQVLSAGGLAAGYYTLYAAHFVPALKVIGSPIAAAVLLCLWAGGMLVYAAWRQGRVLAMMSIGLAYYSTVVNPSGWISLFSSLVLSVAAMVLLMRYRWVWVGAVGLFAAYVSHAFWLGLMTHEVSEGVRITYLSCTWLLYALALQVPQAQRLDPNWRRGLLAFNNAAFWGLLVFRLPAQGGLLLENTKLSPHEHIGWISIAIGLGWILLGLLNWRHGDWRRQYHPLWIFQGLFVATLGMMIEASGYTRFLILAAEACVLMVAARRVAPRWGRLFAILCFIAAVIFSVLEGLGFFAEPPGWLAYFFASLFGFLFVALMRRDVENSPEAELLDFYGGRYRMAPVAFSWIAWVMLISGCILRWDAQWVLIGLFGAPLIFASLRVFVDRDETLDAAWITPFVVVFGGLWTLLADHSMPNGVWATSTLLLTLYWLISDHLRKTLTQLWAAIPALGSHATQWIAAVTLGLVSLRWLGEPSDNATGWLIAAPAAAVAGSAIYLLTRRHSLALVLMLMHFGALATPWCGHLHLELWQTAAPLVFLLVHLAIAERFALPKILRVARSVAGVLISIALYNVVILHNWPQPEWWMGLLGACWLAFSFMRKDAYAACFGGFFALAATSIYALATCQPDEWSPYPVLLILPAASLLTRRLLGQPDINWIGFGKIAGVAGLLLLGIKLSMHVTEIFEGNGLAISWALFAVLLFTVGLVCVDTLFRRFGLFYLAIALVHILAIDVMKLDTLGRILSFLILGGVLMLLGFLYNRFQDKIRKYL